MRDLYYEPDELMKAAGLRSDTQRRLRRDKSVCKLLRWIADNLTHVVENCPECNATPALGEDHAFDCYVWIDIQHERRKKNQVAG